MAKHNVRQTKGNFKLIGNINGVKSERFFKAFTFDSGKTKNQVSFSVKSSNNNENYVTVEGYDADLAKFSKWDNKTKTSEQKEVPWEDRFEFQEKDFSPFFGVTLALELDDKGKSVPFKLFQYDACQELADNLEDGVPVWMEGQIKFSSYSKDGEVKRYKNLVPSKIYRQSKPIDFDEEGYKEENRFEQELIFMGIEQEKDYNTKKATGRFIVDAKIVTYTSVEDAQFIIEDKSLANHIKTKLKPYYAINCLGRLVTRVEEDEDEEAWGNDEDLNGSTIKFREMVITKAYPASIDKETYSEEVLATITDADEDFGEVSNEESNADEVWE